MSITGLDKKYLHYTWSKRVRPIRTIYLLIPFLIFSLVCVISLRQNNLGMIERREAVYQADKTGGDIEGALRELRSYVYSHMNTRVASGQAPVYPPIQLMYTYQRLVEAEQKRLSESNAKVYTDAQNHCEKLYPDSFSGGPRVPCIQEYVDKSGVKPHQVPDSMYKFDFISPTWSPDLAGWSLILAGLFGTATIIRFLGDYLVRRYLD